MERLETRRGLGGLGLEAGPRGGGVGERYTSEAGWGGAGRGGREAALGPGGAACRSAAPRRPALRLRSRAAR